MEVRNCSFSTVIVVNFEKVRRPKEQSKNLEGKDRQRQLLYYETLIRACNKVVYQLVYKGKKFVFLKEPLYLINQ